MTSRFVHLHLHKTDRRAYGRGDGECGGIDLGGDPGGVSVVEVPCA
jgi:hypothetical protein